MAYKFGKTSKRNLSSCHEDLKAIANLVLKRSRIDFTVTEGHRTIERQQMLHKAGKSKIDGINKKGKHNYNPSLALDFCACVPGKRNLAYDSNHLTYIASMFVCCAQELYVAGEISHIIRWGGNWDRDGEIITDQNFDDLCHVELVKVG